MAVAATPPGRQTITVEVPIDYEDLGKLLLTVEIPGIYKRSNASHAHWGVRARHDADRRNKARRLVNSAIRKAKLPLATIEQRRLVKVTLYVANELDDGNCMEDAKLDVDALWREKAIWSDKRRWCRMPYTPEQVMVDSVWREKVVLEVYDLGLAPAYRRRRR